MAGFGVAPNPDERLHLGRFPDIGLDFEPEQSIRADGQPICEAAPRSICTTGLMAVGTANPSFPTGEPP